jgi:hypothetical protein
MQKIGALNIDQAKMINIVYELVQKSTFEMG